MKGIKKQVTLLFILVMIFSMNIAYGESVVNEVVKVEVDSSNLDTNIYKNPQYLFWAYPPNDGERKLISNWTEKNFVEWIPNEIGTYTIKIYIQPKETDIQGDPKDYRIIKDLTYEITKEAEKPKYTLDISGDDTVTIPSKDYKTVKFDVSVKSLENEVDEEVIWSLEGNTDSSITIDQEGNLKVGNTAKDGIVIVTAKLNVDSSITAQKVVTVKQPEIVNVTSVDLLESTIELNIGEVYLLTANVLPSNADNKNIIWMSDNENIVTVDENGRLQAKGIGTANIVVKTDEGEYTDTCKVKVGSDQYKLPETYIIVNTTMIDLYYFIQNPDVLVNELNKYKDPQVYISTRLADVINNGNIVQKVNKVIDEKNPNGKSVVIGVVNVNYKNIIGDVGSFYIKMSNISNVLPNVHYFSLGSEDREKILINREGSISAITESVPIFFFDKKQKLIGISVVDNAPNQQSIVINTDF